LWAKALRPTYGWFGFGLTLQLHHARAGVDREERVGHAAAGVVVSVDRDPGGGRELHRHLVGVRRELVGQGRAVRVAQRDPLGARLRGRAHAAGRVLGVLAIGVEEVLAVVDHALALSAQERDRVGDHREVLLGVHLRHLLQVQPPRLADQAADRREGVGQQAQGRVGVGVGAAPAGHAERDHLGVAERLALEQGEELGLLGVGAREAGLDELPAEPVDGVRHAQLLLDGERHPLTLHAVAQGRVVDLDLLGHAFDGTCTGSSHSR
jgi:hypothetical protein